MPETSVRRAILVGFLFDPRTDLETLVMTSNRQCEEEQNESRNNELTHIVKYLNDNYCMVTIRCLKHFKTYAMKSTLILFKLLFKHI